MQAVHVPHNHAAQRSHQSCWMEVPLTTLHRGPTSQLELEHNMPPSPPPSQHQAPWGDQGMSRVTAKPALSIGSAGVSSCPVPGLPPQTHCQTLPIAG